VVTNVMLIVGDQPSPKQRVKGAITRRTADQLDARARDRLAVGNDSQDVERRLGQPHRLRLIHMPLD
jgi:hypothetical protein